MTETVWITSHLFTRGIIECRAEIDSDGDAFIDNLDFASGEEMLPDGQWWLTREAAVGEARSRIAAKRKSIAKQLKALDVLEAKLKGDTE